MSALPIADFKTVRAHARVLLRDHRSSFVRMLLLYALAAIMALVPAWVIGQITQDASTNQLTSRRVTDLVALLFASSLAYALLSFLARRRSYVLGETIFAQLREEFL